MSWAKPFMFQHVTKVVSGPGSSRQAAAELAALGASRVLVVTDRGVVGAGLLAGLLAGLEAAGLPHAVFDEIEPNPAATTVDRGTAAARADGVDAVVAVGGGSSIDGGKMVALLTRHGGTTADYAGVGPDKVPGPTLPLVAVPTTVGTGSEVTRGAVITDTARNTKMVVISPHILPRVAVLDPELLTRLPAHITAATGMDSLTQAIEAYVSRGANPVTDALNLAALRAIARHLRLAVARNEPEAMAAMQVATTMQGIGFHNAGLGLVHAMSNTVGGAFGTPHGVTNAIILPHVMAFNVAADPERFAVVAEAMGEPVAGLSARAAADRGVAAVRQLSRDIGIPATLGEIGVDPAAIPELAEAAAAANDAPTNPRGFTVQDIVRLFQLSFGMEPGA